MKLDPEYDAYDMLKRVIDDYSKKLIEEIMEYYDRMAKHLINGHMKDFRKLNGKLRELLDELASHIKDKHISNLSSNLSRKLKTYKKNPHSDLKNDIETDLNELDTVSK